jgi:hypothetical protein
MSRSVTGLPRRGNPSQDECTPGNRPFADRHRAPDRAALCHPAAHLGHAFNVSHAYTVAGSFPVELSVADDDGGVDTRSAVVQVLTPEQAVEQILNLR